MPPHYSTLCSSSLTAPNNSVSVTNPAVLNHNKQLYERAIHNFFFFPFFSCDVPKQFQFSKKCWSSSYYDRCWGSSDSLEEVGWCRWSTFSSSWYYYMTKWNGWERRRVLPCSQATPRQICVQRREEKLGSKCWSSSFLFYCSEVLTQFVMTTRSEWEKKKAKEAADELYLISPLSSSFYGSCQDKRGIYSLSLSLSGSRVIGSLQQADPTTSDYLPSMVPSYN